MDVLVIPSGINPLDASFPRAYLKTQKCPKRQEKDTKGFYHRKQRE